jgi:hypothetical protein
MSERSASDRILSIQLTPTGPREYLAATPTRLSFRIEGSVEPWQQVELDLQFGPTNSFLNAIQDIVIDDQSLVEHLMWRGVSLWQFLPSYLWPSVSRAVSLVSALNKVVSDTRPTLIKFAPVNDRTESIWQGIVESIATAHQITCQCTRATPSRLWQGCPAAAFWTQLMPLQVLHRLVKDDLSQPVTTHGRRLLFASQARHWIEGPGRMGHDEQFEPVLRALRGSGWDSFVGVDCPYSPRYRAIGSLWRRAMLPDTRWSGFYAESSIKELRREFNEARDHFRKVWRALKTHSGFRSQFGLENVAFLPPLYTELQRAFATTLPNCAAMLVAAADLIEVHQPDAVAATYETGPYQRALIVEARRRSIPTLGLTHGVILDTHYDYMHKGVAPSLDPQVTAFTIPDVTCTWGAASQKSLTISGHYPGDAVKVTGSWRHDAVRDGLDPARQSRSNGRVPRVLILSAGQHVAHYVETALASLPQACEAVVRLHPADDPEPVLKTLRRAGAEEFFQQGGPLDEQLAQADVVVSQWSTAVSEAILQGKPTVLVDLYGLPGYEAYVRYQACLLATTSQQLAEAIGSALDDTAVRNQLSKNRKRFIKEFYYRLDGKGAERVAMTLDQLVTGRCAPSPIPESHATLALAKCEL